MYVATSPLRVDSYRRLSCLHQQKTQQRTSLPADVSQPLLAATGVLTRNQSYVGADLLAAVEPRRSSDDQHIGQCCKWAHAWMSHQSQRFRALLHFLRSSCG